MSVFQVLCLLAAALGGSTLLERASAQSSGTVVLVHVAGDERIATRLRAELRSRAWRVIEIAPRGDQAQSLETLATNRGATAALRVRPHQLAVELWVTPQPGSDGAASDELIVATGPTADAGVLALRVSEALRARGLGPASVENPANGNESDARRTGAGATPSVHDTNPVAPTSPEPSTASNASNGGVEGTTASGAEPERPTLPTPTEAEPKPSAANSEAARLAADSGAAAPAMPADTQNQDTSDDPSQNDDASDSEAEASAARSADLALYLEIAPALGLSPGGFTASGDAWVNLRLQPLAAVSFSAFALVPVLQSRVRSDVAGNSAGVRTLLAGVGVDLQLDTRAWQWSVGLGAAGVITWLASVQTTDRTQYGTQSETLRTAAGIARVASVWRITSSLHLVGRVLVGASIPQLAIEFPKSETKHWGRPFVIFVLGLEFALPWAR